MSSNNSKLLGVRVDYPFNKKDFRLVLANLLSTNDPKFVFTVNPEFVVDAQRDSLFKKILNSGSFNSADGIGVVFGIEYQNEYIATKNPFKAIFRVLNRYFKGILTKKRLTGVEITEMILDYCNQNYLSVFLLGGDSKKLVSENLLIDLSKKYPNVKFVGASSMFLSKPNDDTLTLDYINRCMRSEGVDVIDFILVGYGHPFQEKWIERNSPKIKAKVYVGVGGTFDFLSGNIKRAPKILQNVGLEWLYRLFIQPKRFKRIFKATVIFSYLIFTKIKR